MSLQESNAGPRLSADGETLLRDVLQRREERTRWERQRSLEPDEPPTPAPDPAPRRSNASVPLVAGICGAVVLFGLILGVAAWNRAPEPTNRTIDTAASETGLDPIESVVAGQTEAREPAPATRSSETPPSSVPVAIIDLPVLSATERGQTAATTEPEATDDTPLLAPEAVAIQAYLQPGDAEGAVTAFALRIWQDGGERLDTDRFDVTVEIDDVSHRAQLRFEQEDLPPNSSAIAAVVLDEPAPAGASITLWWNDVAVKTAFLPANG